MRWLLTEIVIAGHDELIATSGGATGIRDAGLLESALARPQNKHAYGEERLAVLAAAYAVGIAKNHAFIDGNKRTALLALVTFLDINGVSFDPDQAECVAIIEAVASGDATEEDLTAWIEKATT